MEHVFAFGGFIASLLGFILVCRLKYNRNISSPVKNPSSEAFKRSTDGKLRSNTDGSLDVVIVGAGIAGSALAYALGKDGWRVHVIERDLTEPDRMAGEVLQPGGYRKLIELGLEDCVNGIDAQRMFGIAFYKDGRIVRLPFPLEKFPSDVSGFSFLNGRLIQNIRRKASSLSNVRLEEGTVTSLIKEKGTIKGVCYKTRAGEEIKAYAPLTIVCDGCFSNLRRSLCSPKVEITSRFVGFIIENCDLPLPNLALAVLTDIPILFYSIGSHKTRCMVNISGAGIPSISNGEMAKFLKTKVAPQVPPDLRDAFITTIEKGNIKVATNQTMPASPCPNPGGFLIGDSLNMRHPFTGGGMTVALSDVVLLRDLLRPLNNLKDPVAVCKYLESFSILRKPMAFSINSVAGLLSKVFFVPDDPLLKDMSYACFDYLCLGPVFRNGLVSLSSGLYPSPLSLVVQIAALAVFAVGRSLLPFPSPKRLQTAARLLTVTILNHQFPLILTLPLLACNLHGIYYYLSSFYSVGCINCNLPNNNGTRSQRNVFPLDSSSLL